MPDWLQPILGAVLALAGAAVQRWWGRKDAAEAVRRALDVERAGRSETRSEEAAKELFVHIETAFEELARYEGSQVPQDARVRLAAPIHQTTPLLKDADLRERIYKVGTVVANVDVVSKRSRESVGVVLWIVRGAAQDALGAYLRGEPLPEEDASLERYGKIVSDMFDAFAAGDVIDADDQGTPTN